MDEAALKELGDSLAAALPAAALDTRVAFGELTVTLP
ncbi:MAG: NADH-quinone oxidoreductase subunit C, partial [Alphaproteobacteria bacterium]|nr:NADH-quinone oxidoreductase subunit C [Alphaproteobacteria bacterium]